MQAESGKEDLKKKLTDLEKQKVDLTNRVINFYFLFFISY